MEAVILAGGKGVRLRPYTTRLPKPLVPIGDDHAILEIVLHQLARQGFRRVTLAIGHFGHLIRSFVGDGRRWGLDIVYVNEFQPLGTLGPVVGVREDLPDDFLVMNGDVLTDIDATALLRAHVAAAAPLTVATYKRQVTVDLGVIEADAGCIVDFIEKPTYHYRVSTGVYAVSRDALAGYSPGEALGFDRFILDLIRAGRHPAEFVHDGYWLDIGRPDDYDRANEEFGRMRGALLRGA
ncbi:MULTISPECIES: sugar phosphate nucleotidyltransferase [unclassified Isoptericola]|uniref:sugar phosphate nucleotidyltransferase n=1 Tax=unclassified Isoptericola TaxID=2623355 RepID=UPI002712DC42|nr:MULTISPECIES: sugar phosphate nucleotidyltransferase [unclassified Isoptericola]MDO8143840.1 sugar phosphate nucleotidyltransferase [Isoptericola sp. 178]MDO8147735.1 sugar phosphate nucleotidyltransferase [Isoptericola sp. b515]